MAFAHLASINLLDASTVRLIPLSLTVLVRFTEIGVGREAPGFSRGRDSSTRGKATRLCVFRAYIPGMMGKSHATIGLVAGAVIGIAVFGLSSSTWLVSSVAVCGSSIFPDIDEPGSSVSSEFGIISQVFSAVVNKVEGGHRKLTHSLLGLGIVTFILVTLTSGRDASAVIFGLLAASAWRIVFPWWTGLRRLFILVGAGSGYFFYGTLPMSGLWLVTLLCIGWLVHMAGDFLTHGGIPLLYPRASRESLICPDFNGDSGF